MTCCTFERRGGTVAAVLMALAASAGVRAATLTVTTASGGTGGPDCTLRDAVTAANTDTATGACSAGDGADVIELPAGVTFTLTEVGGGATTGSNGLPIILSEITINGNGATVARSGAGGTPGFRILEIDPDGNLTLRNLTVAGGSLPGEFFFHARGGGIYNGGTLTLDHGTVTGNQVARWSFFHQGGGIYNSGMLVLEYSTVSGNGAFPGSGGGIYNAGTMASSYSKVTGNGCAQGHGAGILNLGTAMLDHSTVDGNHPGAYGELGGGIYNEGGMLTLTDSTVSRNSGYHGGGIYNAATMALTNSTVSGNQVNSGELDATSEGIRNDGTATLTNCTVADNVLFPGQQFSVHNGGTLTLTNSILADSTCANFGTVNDNGYNIVEDGSCITAPTSMSGDPNLGPLAENGGPTETHALLAGSMAIDAGDCAGSTVTEDQRGAARPQGPACDIGPYELAPPGPGAVSGLHVDKSGSDLVLSWSADCGLGDSNGIYRGDLAQGYDSIVWDACDVATTEATIGMGLPDGEFFLVVPSWNGQDGSYGAASAGERPPALSACHAQGVIDWCAP